MHDKVLTALQAVPNKLCVMATVGENGQPQTAVMAYVVLNDLTILFVTSSVTRKADNLKKNPNLALSFGWDFMQPNIQYEGVAKLIEKGEEFSDLSRIFFEAHPEIITFRNHDTIIVKVIPKWIRISDYSQIPPKMEEMKL